MSHFKIANKFNTANKELQSKLEHDQREALKTYVSWTQLMYKKSEILSVHYDFNRAFEFGVQWALENLEELKRNGHIKGAKNEWTRVD